MDNNYYYNGDNYKAPESTTEKKKGKNTFGKVAAAGAMGLAFGVFGGLGFFAVQKTTGMIPSSASSDAAQAVIEESTAGSESTGSSENGTGGQSAVLNTVTNSAGLTGSGDVSEVAEALMPAMVSIKKEYTYTYGNDIYSYYF